MKFADDVLCLYQRHFDQEDYLTMFVYSILEQLDQEDLIHVMEECSKEELEEILAIYLIGVLQEKLKESPAKQAPVSLPTWNKFHDGPDNSLIR